MTHEEMPVAMGAVRDQLLALIQEHERTDHGGDVCLAGRASAIAYLAHSIGVRDGAWTYAESLLAEYDAACPGRHDAPPDNFPP